MGTEGPEKLFAVVWKNKIWWLLPLGVLLLLLGVMYALGHLSRTDSEMYPTTQRAAVSNWRAA